MTSHAGIGGFGSVFSIDTNGSGYKSILDFNDTNGANPMFASLIISGNKLFGMTSGGGTKDSGCIFSIDTNGSRYKDLFDFNRTNGFSPQGSLILLDGKLYGMTFLAGSVFSIDTNGNGFKKLLSFTYANGDDPYGTLITSGGMLYGMTHFGGANDDGAVFSIDTNGIGYRNLLDFNGTNGENPYGALTLLGNNLYGMTYIGGAFNEGLIFKINKNSVASVNELNADSKDSKVYPSPSTGIFILQSNSVNINSTIEIYNMLGEKIYTAKLKSVNTQINLGNNAAGIYLYRVLAETGSLISTGKVVIQK